MRNITAEQRSKLPSNVLRLPFPAAEDTAALKKLASMLDEAIDSLATLQVDPIVLAASSNRFNDIYWSDWLAIRCGSFFTERHDYGHPRNFESDLANGPQNARIARTILDRLESLGWRDTFADAFRMEKWGDKILALVIQDELPWLVLSGSNYSEENHVFALWGETIPRYFGECEQRFDWEMQENVPLKFQELSSNSFE